MEINFALNFDNKYKYHAKRYDDLNSCSRKNILWAKSIVLTQHCHKMTMMTTTLIILGKLWNNFDDGYLLNGYFGRCPLTLHLAWRMLLKIFSNNQKFKKIIQVIQNFEWWLSFIFVIKLFERVINWNPFFRLHCKNVELIIWKYKKYKHCGISWYGRYCWILGVSPKVSWTLQSWGFIF